MIPSDVAIINVVRCSSPRLLYNHFDLGDMMTVYRFSVLIISQAKEPEEPLNYIESSKRVSFHTLRCASFTRFLFVLSFYFCCVRAQ